MKRKHDLINTPDFKDSEGVWRRTYTENGLSCKTRAAVLFESIAYRSESTIDPRYSDVKNLFESFQEFTEWCQTEYGYLFKESNGKHWALDKDIINPEFRHYSPDVCLFVPERVNAFFTFTKQGRNNGLPVGVY